MQGSSFVGLLFCWSVSCFASRCSRFGFRALQRDSDAKRTIYGCFCDHIGKCMCLYVCVYIYMYIRMCLYVCVCLCVRTPHSQSSPRYCPHLGKRPYPHERSVKPPCNPSPQDPHHRATGTSDRKRYKPTIKVHKNKTTLISSL